MWDWPGNTHSVPGSTCRTHRGKPPLGRTPSPRLDLPHPQSRLTTPPMVRCAQLEAQGISDLDADLGQRLLTYEQSGAELGARPQPLSQTTGPWRPPPRLVATGKDPWLNPIEPTWVHSKRAIVEPTRLLTAQGVVDRVCAYHGCPHEPHLSPPGTCLESVSCTCTRFRAGPTPASGGYQQNRGAMRQIWGKRPM
jgi:hypothetical protein